MALPAEGDTFGRYLIVRQIGRGGMGAVFEASDTTLNRSVALKVVLPAYADLEEYRIRFEREAAALAHLRSPNILQIHEFGELDGCIYFVSEYFPDGDLQRRLKERGPLRRDLALDLVAQLCDALHDAHAARVIHRDVKPSNVLLWVRPTRIIPYLCDFGIAIREEHHLTRTGSMAGSLAYMAPERHVGEPADERGDIYSAGCVLYATLSGTAPYAGTDFQLMEAHIRQPIPEIPVGDDVDTRINEIINRAMRKDPKDRYTDAAQMAADLRDVLARDTSVTGEHTVTSTRPRPEQPVSDRTLLRGAVAAIPPVSSPDLAEQPVAKTSLRPSTVKRSKVEGDADEPAALTSLRPPSTPSPGGGAGDSQPGGTGDVAGSAVGAGADAAAIASTATPPAAPPDGPVLSTPGAGSPRRRKARLVVAGALAALLVAGGVSYAVLAGGDKSPTRKAADTTTQSASPSAAPLARPRVTATPAYRAVAYQVELPAGATLQLRKGGKWVRATSPIKTSTAQGGDRRCIEVRAVDTGQQSPSVRQCGRAQKRTLTVDRLSDQEAGGVLEVCFAVKASGFRSNTSPMLWGRIGTGTMAPRFTVSIDASGRGNYKCLAFPPSNTHDTVTMRLEGVRHTFTVPPLR